MARKVSGSSKKANSSKAHAKKNPPKSKSHAKAVYSNEGVKPIRRELGSIMLFLLSVCVFISYFISEGSLVIFVSDCLKGLVGWGYWISGISLFLGFLILMFHKGRPVIARTLCALSMPLLFGCVACLVNFDSSLFDNFDFAFVSNYLFTKGKELEAMGGALSGLLSLALVKALSLIGAGILVVISFLICLYFSLCNLFADNSGKITSKLSKMSTATYNPDNFIDYDYQNQSIPNFSDENLKRKNFNSSQEEVKKKEINTFQSIGVDNGFDADSLFSRRPGKFSLNSAKQTHSEKTKIIVGNDGFDVSELSGGEAPLSPSTVSTSETERAAVSKANKSEITKESKRIAAEIKNSIASPEEYKFPPVELLRKGVVNSGDAREEILTAKSRLEQALKSFGINSSIVSSTRGPAVTRYDIELEQGVKLSKVTVLAGDLALSLGVINVRIAPIPDMISTVGIEVPNKIVSTVYLRDIIESSNFRNAKSKTSFALGKDIGGGCIVGNIAKLPHMLIAGTTGSGKSVCINSLIVSILYKARPEEVRFIMIDPKMVELGIYNGIPHLYVPVVTEPKKAAGALQWAVVEMLKRYRMFSEAGVRDINAFNKMSHKNNMETIPQIVVVIDELADLMLAASKDVEESICRVAQMGRAAGMHLIIATQRPSADVITGLMKANIPSRIAFAVSSAMESRIILDQSGAEKLVGMGDMLYSPVGCGKPVRIQGAFVSDEEREDVIQFIKENSGAEVGKNDELESYMNKALEGKNGADSKNDDSGQGFLDNFDEMLPRAVQVVIEMKTCSVSMLQRRLKLGYSRAARIVDEMEELKIVGPYEGAKPRTVLVDNQAWLAIQRELGMAGDDYGDDVGYADGDELLYDEE